MLIHLELRARAGSSRYTAMRRAFLDGYGTSDTDLDDTEMRLFTMTRALQMLARDAVADRDRRTLRTILMRCLA